MYLHIGKDVCVDYKNIIGIFDIESLRKSKIYEDLLEDMKENIINISEGKDKTVILSKENDVIKGYISNILSVTLEKRVTENIF